ncbi:MAG: urate hydroxylase PuuD, partial [Myxococcales bacterium]|nr:urate hydroxylase PuuD [Myxococcales bacterium]
NNYFTLPVLFIMVSNHYPMTYGHQWNWAILAGISLAGMLTRHWFNLRGKGHRNVWLLPVAAVAMVSLALVSAPKTYAGREPVAFSEVRQIIERRCVSCHSASPTSEIYQAAPQGIMFDRAESIVNLAARINTAVVVSRIMPLGNMTEMSDEERDLIGAWYYQGAKSE